jgi:hypothetical protein
MNIAYALGGDNVNELGKVSSYHTNNHIATPLKLGRLCYAY